MSDAPSKQRSCPYAPFQKRSSLVSFKRASSDWNTESRKPIHSISSAPWEGDDEAEVFSDGDGVTDGELLLRIRAESQTYRHKCEQPGRL